MYDAFLNELIVIIFCGKNALHFENNRNYCMLYYRIENILQSTEHSVLIKKLIYLILLENEN